jgi:4-hydroxythreonine-4-phosphate dehydrogenase
MLTSPDRRKHYIAVTMGDPCGVGPEIIVKALSGWSSNESFLPLIIGDLLALRRAAELLDARTAFYRVQDFGEITQGTDGIPILTPQELSANDLAYGHPTEKTCTAVIQYIEVALKLAMHGSVAAICTCPIHKANLQRYGFDFPGHTEFLQHLTGAERVGMMLVGPKLRVSLATIHHSLRDVPEILNRQRLIDTIHLTGEALMRDFTLQSPHLAVAALNPHAGEEGKFGHEESLLIRPVIDSCTHKGYRVSGPYSADTLFFRAYRGEFDAVVAMYHDQGLIPIKLVHFHEAVNLTLGLPIIRTSVDHGTAYELAGTGSADPGSLQAAIQLADSIVRNRFSKSLPPNLPV